MFTVKGYLPDSSYEGTAVYKPFAMLAPSLKAAGTTDEYRIPEFLPCFDQEQWGSCVLNAWVGLLEILKGLEDGNVEQLSRAWLYAQVRLVQGTFDEDSGTYPYLAGDRISKVGVVPEKIFPYVADNLPPNDASPPGFKPNHPDPAIYVEASDNKVNAFYRIDDTDKGALLDNIELAVRANHPVVWGGQVNVSQIVNWKPSDPAIDVPATFNGGHSTLLTGVRRLSTGARWFRVRNSWGSNICDNGYFWITDNYLASRFVSDFWAGTRMPGLIV